LSGLFWCRFKLDQLIPRPSLISGLPTRPFTPFQSWKPGACYQVSIPQLDFVRPSSGFHPHDLGARHKPRATLDSLDSPRPGLGRSHHLPPYSILCITPREPHPNGTFSRDSQGGVPKLSRVELPGLWTLISPGSNL
jgi:hypothetical protein